MWLTLICNTYQQINNFETISIINQSYLKKIDIEFFSFKYNEKPITFIYLI